MKIDNSEQQGGCLKYLFHLAVLTIVDFILIWFWVRQIDPDPSVSIELLYLVPSIFILNIVVAIIVAFIKKQFAWLFLINSVISSILLYFLFINGIDRRQNERYESWQYNSNDTTFEITLSKIDSTFSITYSKNSSSWVGFMDGKYITEKNQYFLTSDTTKLVIDNQMLLGFRNDMKGIKLTKMER